MQPIYTNRLVAAYPLFVLHLVELFVLWEQVSQRYHGLAYQINKGSKSSLFKHAHTKFCCLPALQQTCADVEKMVVLHLRGGYLTVGSLQLLHL